MHALMKDLFFYKTTKNNDNIKLIENYFSPCWSKKKTEENLVLCLYSEQGNQVGSIDTACVMGFAIWELEL